MNLESQRERKDEKKFFFFFKEIGRIFSTLVKDINLHTDDPKQDKHKENHT